MPWLWFAGPLTFLFVVVIFNLWPTAEERRLRGELRRWLDNVLGPLLDDDGEEETREVLHLPAVLERVVADCGGGAPIANIALVPGYAYLAVRAADALTSSNHYTVACKLEKRAPRLVCRPLAIVDGRPVENDGIAFKDTEFMDHYVVEGDATRDIKRWMRPDLREALMQFPDLWLRVDGQLLTLSFYGAADAEMLDELIEVADVIFAEYGGGGAAPLFGDDAVAGGNRKMPEAVPDPVDSSDDEEIGGIIEVTASKQDRVTAGVIDFSLYGIGAVMLVAVLGYFPGFHPSVLFNSPDLTVTEPWQGGWTTKGFGALVLVESYLFGLVAWQAHLAVKRGQSIGKRLVGIQVNVVNGGPRTFMRMVFLRKWLFLAVPLAAAAVYARPFSARAFFSHIPTKITGAAALGIGLVLLVAWITSDKLRGLHDLVAGTEVVACERYRLPVVQLAAQKNDPLVQRRLVWGACALVAFIGMNLATLIWADAWFFEVHQWR